MSTALDTWTIMRQANAEAFPSGWIHKQLLQLMAKPFDYQSMRLAAVQAQLADLPVCQREADDVLLFLADGREGLNLAQHRQEITAMISSAIEAVQS